MQCAHADNQKLFVVLSVMAVDQKATGTSRRMPGFHKNSFVVRSEASRATGTLLFGLAFVPDVCRFPHLLSLSLFAQRHSFGVVPSGAGEGLLRHPQRDQRGRGGPLLARSAKSGAAYTHAVRCQVNLPPPR